MARDIDVVQDFVRRQSHIPPVHRQVLLARIEQEPTKAELDAAKDVVYPDDNPPGISDLLMEAWGLIANVGTQRGGWDAETGEWMNAAERWRDRFHGHLRDTTGSASTGRMQVAAGKASRGDVESKP